MSLPVVCRFCGQSGTLQESHIIPSFVLRWLKESGLTALRTNQAPNRRVQDGPKVKLLCSACEQLFGAWEKGFAENVFVPFHERRREALSYGPWALKFAVSVSWRVFQYFAILGDFDHLSSAQQKDASLACRYWEEFLKGSRPHPDIYEQHIIALDGLEHVPDGKWSPFLNRYIMRSSGIDVVTWDHCAMVYTKMGRLLLFGFLTRQERRSWVGTRLHVREGCIGAKRYKVPPFVFSHINDLSEIVASSIASISPAQYEKVERAFLKKVSEGRESELVRAIRQDVRLFGEQAFTVTSPKESEEYNPGE
jgi:hypothetical protein